MSEESITPLGPPQRRVLEMSVTPKSHKEIFYISIDPSPGLPSCEETIPRTVCVNSFGFS